ncbi:conserved hypothetical protein [Paraburkholderia tropica]|uniref:hypothetical protein n=1 Tax=Paraburkholderia tropica TaxID=92647 RepID=UPI001CAD0343|nr:hypothetical protein [Paraburkholderia tropica]CAG9204998.1 conserved hypothetical protein [Paraburkholderia tropica]
MSNPIAVQLFSLFRREHKSPNKNAEAANARAEPAQRVERVERAALYARHGYFHASFTPLLYPFVPEIPPE